MAKFSTGIDVTAMDIRMVSLTPKGHQLHLTGHAIAALNDAEAVRNILASSTRRSTTRFSIHDGMIKIRKITIPKVPKEEINEVIRWILKEAQKSPLDDHTLRYYPLSGAPEKQQNYLTIAIERKKLQDYLIELQKKGAQYTNWVEPNVQALANCVNHNYELQASDRVAIVHMDSLLAFFTIVSSEGILFYRTFTRVNGCANAAGDLEQFFSLLMVEIQYSCGHYSEQFPNQPISSSILSGEGGTLPRLQEHVEEILQVPTQILDTFKKVGLSEEQRSILANTAAQYGIAMGLAL